MHAAWLQHLPLLLTAPAHLLLLLPLQIELEPASHIEVDVGGEMQLAVECLPALSDVLSGTAKGQQLLAAFAANALLQQAFGTLDVLCNSWIAEGLVWCSNRQSPAEELRGRLNSTGDNSGDVAIVEACDCMAALKVR